MRRKRILAAACGALSLGFQAGHDLPGGMEGLREVSRRFRARGGRVFADYNPWDTGTRREGKSDVEALAEIVKAVEADGIWIPGGWSWPVPGWGCTTGPSWWTSIWTTGRATMNGRRRSAAGR